MKGYIISGIQQMGIGVLNLKEAWDWYNRHFGMDCRMFEEEAEARLMLPYTGGEPRRRHAVLVLNLQSGGGFEIWQYKGREPIVKKDPIRIGDLGILICKIKTRNSLNTLVSFRSKGMSVPTKVTTDPSGKKTFYMKDLYGNLFQIVEAPDWFINEKKMTGGSYGAVIGVTDIEKSRVVYSDILGYDDLVYDKTGFFQDLAGLPGGETECRRVLLRRSIPFAGPFSKILGNSEIEIVDQWNQELKIEYAILDHDGTLSTLREGWEHIMRPMMVKAVLGKKFITADESLFQKVQDRVSDYIDKTTGIQTLVQMKGLLDLIREFRCVPEKEMLDEFGYKKIYNDELLDMVNVRENKFRNGELGLEDLTIKNAVLFLQRLFDAGVKLYLASGTDEEDVKKEAEALGYAHLFEGRIFGAVGDVTKEAKKIVLDRILNTIGESSYGKLITFGDGPVEIRETRKRGGISIGIASNELRRFGLNINKRVRLIKAGAHVIIPDFSQLDRLLTLINL